MVKKKNKTEEYINLITKLIIAEDVDSSVSPVDYYNHWIQKSGIYIADLAMASRLLNFIKEALENKNILTHFI